MAISNNNSKIIVFILLFLSFFLAINFGYAEGTTKPLNLQNAFKTPLETAAGQGAGYNTTATPEGMISLIIKTALSFIGVLFLVLAIYGGYIWMMARGNEQEVEKAKNTLTAAVIGLVIIVAAYAISIFVMSKLEAGTLRGGGGGTTAPMTPTTQGPGPKSYPIEGGTYDPDTGSIWPD